MSDPVRRKREATMLVSWRFFSRALIRGQHLARYWLSDSLVVIGTHMERDRLQPLDRHRHGDIAHSYRPHDRERTSVVGGSRRGVEGLLGAWAPGSESGHHTGTVDDTATVRSRWLARVPSAS